MVAKTLKQLGEEDQAKMEKRRRKKEKRKLKREEAKKDKGKKMDKGEEVGTVVEEEKVEMEGKKKDKKRKMQNGETNGKKMKVEEKEKNGTKEDMVVEEEVMEEVVAKQKKKKDKESTKVQVTEKVVVEEEEETGVFKKRFLSQTTHLSATEVSNFYKEHSITMMGRGHEAVRPILEFSDLTLDPRCTAVSCKGFKNPTPIQSLCWPVISSGRDIIGIAETGSGKTLAFSVPAIAHLIHRKINPVKGIPKSPMMLVLAPTRELAMQSQVVLEQAGKKCKIRSACLYGGVSKFGQRESLRAGVEVIVATPGRLLDLMEEEECDLSGVSYLVLDEADRMLDQGFERAIRAIIAKTHPSRQTCLFSATWPDSIRELAHEFLSDPIKVTIGSEDLSASTNVTQIVEVVEERTRDTLLRKLLTKYHKNNNRILIFVLYKKEADRVLNTLTGQGWNCTAIHGDKSQEARIQAVADFKSGSVPILVATDVAARGLDIPDVEYVINYSFPLTIEDYVHRIGRTGRAGKSGTAHTFFHEGDKLRAGELVNVLKESNQAVPKEMMRFDLSVKRKEHKLYGAFGPKTYDEPMKKASKIKFDD